MGIPTLRTHHPNCTKKGEFVDTIASVTAVEGTKQFLVFVHMYAYGYPTLKNDLVSHFDTLGMRRTVGWYWGCSPVYMLGQVCSFFSVMFLFSDRRVPGLGNSISEIATHTNCIKERTLMDAVTYMTIIAGTRIFCVWHVFIGITSILWPFVKYMGFPVS